MLGIYNKEHNDYIAYLKSKEKSKNTIRNYSYAIKCFFDFADDKDWSDIEKDNVIEYKEYLMDKYGPNTVNLHIVALNGFLCFAHKKDERVNTIRIQERYSIETITFDEYKKMLDVAKDKKIDTYYLMKALACTGIRFGELKNMTVEAIKKGECRIRHKEKVRYMVITEELRKLLLEYCELRNIKSGIIFHAKDKNRAVMESTVLRRLKRVAILAGVDVKKVFPHNLRHLFAKRFIEENGDLSELADILGHSRIETTRIYTRSSLDEKRVKVQNLGL